VPPLSGAFWGAFMTLLGQSSSATTMTTIGLVSAGLLTFPQGLGLVFSSRVGPGFRRKRRHPGTGWLVALVGVLLGGGRIAARGGRARRFCACALRTDDSATGHGRARESLHPSDLPAVLVRQEPAGYPARSASGRWLWLGS
jgi:phosphate:Na+ symporter